MVRDVEGSPAPYRHSMKHLRLLGFAEGLEQ